MVVQFSRPQRGPYPHGYSCRLRQSHRCHRRGGNRTAESAWSTPQDESGQEELCLHFGLTPQQLEELNISIASSFWKCSKSAGSSSYLQMPADSSLPARAAINQTTTIRTDSENTCCALGSTGKAGTAPEFRIPFENSTSGPAPAGCRSPRLALL